MSTESSPIPPSGLTVDGVAVPADIEAAGPAAIAAHVAAAVPSPVTDEGAES